MDAEGFDTGNLAVMLTGATIACVILGKEIPVEFWGLTVGIDGLYMYTRLKPQ